MGMSRGKGKKFGGTGGKDRIQIADTRKIKNYIELQSNLKIFIASIYINSRKVLEEEMRVI